MSLSASQFGRSGPRDDRRRRLLVEGRAASPQDAAAPTVYPVIRVASPPLHKTEHYGDALFLEEQPRLVDLVPERPIFFALLLVAGLAVIAGLEALYVWVPEIVGTPAGRIAALDLGGNGSLAGWFSSLVMLAAGGVALLVYSVRRHRADDYRGRYRIWLWAAACWFLLATDQSASLHDGFRDLMHRATGSLLLGDGSVWWIMACGLLLVWVGTKLLIDLWPCRLSSASLGLAASCYAAAVLVRLAWPSPHDALRPIMLQQGAAMSGHVFVSLAMGLYARHVILDARGLLPHFPAIRMR